MRSSNVLTCLILLLLPTGTPAAGQSVLDRTPNLSAGWVGGDHQLQFNFLHRFRSGRAPVRKVENTPTLVTTYTLPGQVMLGFQYSSNSDLVARIPNEWEFLGRWAPLGVGSGAPVDLAVTAAYNEAARSGDGELAVAAPFGPLRLVGTARAFSDGFGDGEARYALGGGAVVRLSDNLALAADVTSLLDRGDAEKVAWGAALQIGVPFTPHSLSLQVSNTNSGTLQGSSRGLDDTRWGFEFTIPVTIERFLPRRSTPGGAGEVPGAEVTENTVIVIMRDLAYGLGRITVTPGTRVVWVNRDQVAHTSTSDGGLWDSGLLGPGESWSHVFSETGDFPFHCTPHPFMTGVVVVREP